MSAGLFGNKETRQNPVNHRFLGGERELRVVCSYEFALITSVAYRAASLPSFALSKPIAPTDERW